MFTSLRNAYEKVLALLQRESAQPQIQFCDAADVNEYDFKSVSIGDVEPAQPAKQNTNQDSPSPTESPAIPTSKPIFPWYGTIADDSIEQGDLFFNYEVIVPIEFDSKTPEKIPLSIQSFDLILMTQSCDIGNGKVKSVLLCPFWDLVTFIDGFKKSGGQWGSTQTEALRQGNMPGYHLLNDLQDGQHPFNFKVVDFKEVYSSPINQLRKFVATENYRIRLLPPYREHLAQAFARFFMRVGLPLDIDKNRLKKSTK